MTDVRLEPGWLAVDVSKASERVDQWRKMVGANHREYSSVEKNTRKDESSEEELNTL
jgi:hypothetical protein